MLCPTDAMLCPRGADGNQLGLGAIKKALGIASYCRTIATARDLSQILLAKARLGQICQRLAITTF